MTNSLPTDVLEARAADQRRRLHNSVVELKSHLRETLDLRKAAREHLRPAAGVAVLAGLFLGYAFTGMLTRR